MRAICTLVSITMLQAFALSSWAQGLPLDPAPVYPEDLSAADAVIFKGATFSTEIQTYNAGVTLPLFSSEKHLILTEANVAWTDPLEEQANIGLIHRWQFPNKDWVVGENVFFDYSKSQNGNGYVGLGVGGEILAPGFEARFNYYWPDPRRAQLSSRQSQSTTVTTMPDGNAQIEFIDVNNNNEPLPFRRQDFVEKTTNTFEDFTTYETALQGFDAEVGVPLRIKRETVVPTPVGGKNPVLVDTVETSFFPENLNVWAFLGYHDFNNPCGPDQSGFRGRLEWRVNPYLLIETTYYENPWGTVGSNWYTGFRVNCPLGEEDGRGLVDKLFTPQAPTRERDRWLQRVVRESRHRFAEFEKGEEGMNMSTERFSVFRQLFTN